MGGISPAVGVGGCMGLPGGAGGYTCKFSGFILWVMSKRVEFM